jgi:hypothetical protein
VRRRRSLSISRAVSALWLSLGLGSGIALGLAVAWLIWPQPPAYTDLAHVRRAYQEDYALMVSAAYERDGDLARAQERLSYLGNTQRVRQLVTTLADQAIEQESDLSVKRRLARLAAAVGTDSVAVMAYAATPAPETPTPTVTVEAAPTETPTAPAWPSPRLGETQTPTPTNLMEKATAMPTVTATPTREAEYRLVEVKPSSCGENARPGYIVVNVRDALGQGLPGIHIIVSWASGQDEFVTGLHPDQDPGYADYIMSPEISYTIVVAKGTSDTAKNLEALFPKENCQEPASPGSWQVIFRRRD